MNINNIVKKFFTKEDLFNLDIAILGDNEFSFWQSQWERIFHLITKDEIYDLYITFFKKEYIKPEKEAFASILINKKGRKYLKVRNMILERYRYGEIGVTDEYSKIYRKHKKY